MQTLLYALVMIGPFIGYWLASPPGPDTSARRNDERGRGRAPDDHSLRCMGRTRPTVA